MSKKRVYELAKELGIDNKEMIARLEKLGIAVKSHSSTLEESDVERVRKAMTPGATSTVVEERVKRGVIRRRAVQQAAEEAAPPAEEPSPAPEPEAAAPVREEREEKKPEAEKAEEPRIRVVPPPEKKKEAAKKASEAAAAPPEAPATPSVVPPVAKKALERKEAPPREAAKPEPARAKAVPEKREKSAKPKETVPPPAKEAAPPRPPAEEEKDFRKKKRPVEVLIDEVPARKKTFARQRVDRKGKRVKDGLDAREVVEVRKSWREEKREVLARVRTTEITTPKAIKRRIKVQDSIQVGEMAKRMGVKASEVIGKLISAGFMMTINQSLDVETATLIAGDFGYQVEAVGNEYEQVTRRVESSSDHLHPRAPVVTIMGHVDHGKTSLLDAIRETNVIEQESGGITQSIGAYHVSINGRDIVFLDTPGHEAFTAMRARGAKVTDIVVLVVAADDGVMEQTVEAINHAKAAGVPIIVAVNKIDKQGADPDRIKNQLTEMGLVPEAWGGDTIYAEVSAKKKIGIPEMMELILLQADVMELKADPDKPARGVIIESKLDRGRGAVATVIVQEGTLKEGDAVVSRMESGKVRAMLDDKGKRVKTAGPSMPVEVIGFSSVPQAGMEFVCVEDERLARSIVDHWARKKREGDGAQTSKTTLEQLYDRIRQGAKEFSVIIKADVQGSVEALSDTLGKLSTESVKLKIIHASTGTITETDVLLASASDAIIIGFRVRPEPRIDDIAAREGIEVKYYEVIYDITADVKAAMEGLLEPVYEETIQGHAEVKQVFKIPKIGAVAGSFVTDGKITRTANVRLLRDGVPVFDGHILSLKRFKDDAKEVMEGFECGIGIENCNDIREQDIIESYTREAVRRKLE